MDLSNAESIKCHFNELIQRYGNAIPSGSLNYSIDTYKLALKTLVLAPASGSEQEWSLRTYYLSLADIFSDEELELLGKDRTKTIVEDLKLFVQLRQKCHDRRYELGLEWDTYISKK